MKRRLRFPSRTGYQFGDAQHLPIIPALQPSQPKPVASPVNSVNSVKKL